MRTEQPIYAALAPLLVAAQAVYQEFDQPGETARYTGAGWFWIVLLVAAIAFFLVLASRRVPTSPRLRSRTPQRGGPATPIPDWRQGQRRR